MYRFGDGTPFPLSENFIDTLVAAVEATARLYRREAENEERERQVHEARKAAADDLRRLDNLRSLIDTAVTPMKGKGDRPLRESEAAAARIFETAESILRQSRTKILRRRNSLVEEASPPALNRANLADLASFFLRFQLPRTEWRVRWESAQERAVADIGAQATRDLELSFEATIPDDSQWARALVVADLLPGCDAVLRVSADKPYSLALSECVITQVHVGPGREAMVLHQASKRSSPGIHIVMPGPGERAPLAVPLNKRDQPAGQPHYLDDRATGALFSLWQVVTEHLNILLNHRSDLAAARLRGRNVIEIEHPSELAEAIMLEIAPLVRDVRLRSRVPGELILKRDLGGDRREELFVSRQTLLNMIEDLPPRHRRLYEAIGLSDEATQDFAHRLIGPAPSSVPIERPRAMPRSSAPPTIEIEADAPTPAEIARLTAGDHLPYHQSSDEPTIERTTRTEPPSELSGIIEALS